MKVNVKPYEKVLVALDIYSSYEPVLNRAVSLVNNNECLNLVYVTLPHAYFEPYAVDVGRDLSAIFRRNPKYVYKTLPEPMVFQKRMSMP